MDLWSSAAAAAAAAYSPRRVSVPVLVREGSATATYSRLSVKQEAALMAQAHLVGLGSPLSHFPFPALHHFPHHLLMPPHAIPTSSSSSHLPPPSSLLSAFGQNLKASGGGSGKLW